LYCGAAFYLIKKKKSVFLPEESNGGIVLNDEYERTRKRMEVTRIILEGQSKIIKYFYRDSQSPGQELNLRYLEP
jgi:hypothetical protein